MKPIPTTGLTSADVEDLTRTTRELMLAEIIELTAKARGASTAVAAPATTGKAGVTKASGVDAKR